MTQRKPCDGTWQDYRRHQRAGEQACKASLRAWADRQKKVRERLRKQGKAHQQ